MYVAEGERDGNEIVGGMLASVTDYQTYPTSATDLRLGEIFHT